MDNILILDTSVGSRNKGDDIIMECVYDELRFLRHKNFVLTLPTHVSSFHFYQVLRNSLAIQTYTNCKYKFAGGTNLLVKDMLTHYPQWNINWWNSKPFKGLVLMGVGAGAGEKTNWYTKKLYNKILSHNFLHSVRDERSKKFVESLGLKAINTGCVTLWKLTPEFCKTIPSQKSNKVVFTLTATEKNETDQKLINLLIDNYKEIYFWPQGYQDYDYLHLYNNIENIKILEASKDAYDDFLTNNDTDYVGTRLHGGIYALRHKRRAIILAIDERARGIHKSNNIPCIEKTNLEELKTMINSEFVTKIVLNNEAINSWKIQFK